MISQITAFMDVPHKRRQWILRGEVENRNPETHVRHQSFDLIRIRRDHVDLTSTLQTAFAFTSSRFHFCIQRLYVIRAAKQQNNQSLKQPKSKTTVFFQEIVEEEEDLDGDEDGPLPFPPLQIYRPSLVSERVGWVGGSVLL